MLITKSSFSQSVYPKLIVIEPDTLCAVTLAQLDSINATSVYLDECNELNDSLNSEIKTYGELVHAQKVVIAAQDKENQDLKNAIGEKDKIIKIDDDMNKRLNRKVKWIKLQRNVLSLAVVATTIWIAIIL